MFSFFPSANKASIKLKKSLAQIDSKMWYEKTYLYGWKQYTSHNCKKMKKREKARDAFPTLGVIITCGAFVTFFMIFLYIFMDFL